MLIHIPREKIYKAALKEKRKKLLKKVTEEIMNEEFIEEEYAKYLQYSQTNYYKSLGGTIEINSMRCGYYTLEEFVNQLANIITKMILKDIEECKKYGIKNEDGYLYVPLDVLDTLNSNNEYGYPGNGRLLVQGFDWSYDSKNNYDYSFVVYMTI